MRKIVKRSRLRTQNPLEGLVALASAAPTAFANAHARRALGHAPSYGPSSPRALWLAPRWKQRALYDSVKDAAALSNIGFRLARLSVFDTIEGTTFASLLDGSATISPSSLRQYVEGRLL
ncbi:DUF7255 family protein [Arthrobacter burdickii]|uniref:DUF7255 family protein n=1 Tax=Arthrobacter burdickii TaxID=3035920 RepID=UPI003F4DFF00